MGNEVRTAKVRRPRITYLVRDRLERTLDQLDVVGLGVVTAPAGAGKTTLLTRTSERFEGDTAWFRADHGDAEPARLIAGLARALDLSRPPDDVDALIDELEARQDPLLLVIDDVHTIAGTRAANAMQQIMEYRPSRTTVLLGSRPQGALETSRLLVNGELIAVTAEDLRFRLWETEALYREHYMDTLPPQDIARLNQLTGGWIAALHLFHIASSEQSLDARRRLLGALRGRTLLTDDYLAQNVVAGLPAELSSFFISTSVLGTLSVPTCDTFLERSDSHAQLAELERRGLVTRLDDTTFSCHEVLRSHLEARLVESLPADRVHERFTRAGALLDQAGLAAEAIRAYARAGDFVSVTRVLANRESPEIAEGLSFEALPASLRADPWLLLARGRMLAAHGDFWAALEVFREALALAPRGQLADKATHAVLDLQAWAEPRPSPPPTAAGLLRKATVARPRAAARACGERAGPSDLTAGAAGSLIAGDRFGADAMLGRAIRRPDLDAVEVNQIRALELLTQLLSSGTVEESEVERVADLAQKAGCPSTARLVWALPALTGGAVFVERARAVVDAAEEAGDRWGAALAHLAADLGALTHDHAERRPGPTSRERFEALGSPVLALWAGAAELLTSGLPSVDELRGLEARARELDVPGVRLLALRSLSRLDRRAGEPFAALTRELGLDLWGAVSSGPAVSLDISCFGRFTVRVGHRELPLADLRPRARELLRLLAIQDGRPMSADRIGDHLWPGGDPQRTRRSLQVGISAIRTWLAAAGATGVVERRDDSYLLDSRLVSSDVSRLWAAQSSTSESPDAHETILRLAAAPLLPDDRAAEWLSEYTRPLINTIVTSARAVATAGRSARDHDAVNRACTIGLLHDPFCDDLWRLRIEDLRERGDVLGAAQAEADYAAAIEAVDLK